MPIRPEMAARYPKDWKDVRRRIQERARNKCEWCGVPNRRWVFRMRSDHRQWMWAYTRDKALRARAVVMMAFRAQRGTPPPDLTTPVEIVCTTAHIHDRNPENCEDSNLVLLCQLCHNRHDAKDRAEGIRERRDKRAGKRSLFDRERSPDPGGGVD